MNSNNSEEISLSETERGKKNSFIRYCNTIQASQFFFSLLGIAILLDLDQHSYHT